MPQHVPARPTADSDRRNSAPHAPIPTAQLRTNTHAHTHAHTRRHTTRILRHTRRHLQTQTHSWGCVAVAHAPRHAPTTRSHAPGAAAAGAAAAEGSASPQPRAAAAQAHIPGCRLARLYPITSHLLLCRRSDTVCHTPLARASPQSTLRLPRGTHIRLPPSGTAGGCRGAALPCEQPPSPSHRRIRGRPAPSRPRRQHIIARRRLSPPPRQHRRPAPQLRPNTPTTLVRGVCVCVGRSRRGLVRDQLFRTDACRW